MTTAIADAMAAAQIVVNNETHTPKFLGTFDENGVPSSDPHAAKMQAMKGNPGSGSASMLARAIEIEESDGLRNTLIVDMTDKFRALALAEDTLSKGLMADAVQSIVNVLGLPEPNRPKYAKIAELILVAMGRKVYAVSQVRLPDETLQNREAKNNAYRQYATPFVTLARWERGLFTKPELAHQERNPTLKHQIVYNNAVYTSPISALQDGVPYSTCYRLFRNVFAPSFTDLSTLDAAKTMAVGKAMVKKHGVVLLGVDDSGSQKRARVLVSTSAALVAGTIIGLCEAWKKPLSQSQYDQITAALVYVAPKQTA